MKLDIKAFSLTCGTVWGLALFSLTWWVIGFDGASGDPTLIARLYRGYSFSPAGSIVGLLWGVADGVCLGALFAWVYNHCADGAALKGGH